MHQIQNSQVHSQQLQIQNLKAQIKIFEERFGGMELSFEASLNQARQEASIDSQRQASILQGQLQIAETYLKTEVKKHHDLEEQLQAAKKES